MKICSLSSGSKGNSLFIESDHARVLVDIGLTSKQIRLRLESIGVPPGEIDAIVITHAHADHVRGAGVFSRQMGAPIYAHMDTLEDMAHLLRQREKLVPCADPFKIKDLNFIPFRVSHDAFPTLGYLISDNRKTLAVCTDTGFVTEEIEAHLRQADLLVLESNHDPDMLINGPYPWELKERIASRVGHLSNQDAGGLLRKIMNGRIEKILLAHLSEENNTPDTARNTVLEHLGPAAETLLEVLEQKTVSPVFNL